MTFNGGGTWQQIKAPTKFNFQKCDRCGGAKECRLHLHGKLTALSLTLTIEHPPPHTHTHCLAVLGRNLLSMHGYMHCLCLTHPGPPTDKLSIVPTLSNCIPAHLFLPCSITACKHMHLVPVLCYPLPCALHVANRCELKHKQFTSTTLSGWCSQWKHKHKHMGLHQHSCMSLVCRMINSTDADSRVCLLMFLLVLLCRCQQLVLWSYSVPECLQQPQCTRAVGGEWQRGGRGIRPG